MNINNVSIKTPSKFTIKTYAVTIGGRSSDAYMNIDLIAYKRQFDFNYTIMSDVDYKALMNLLLKNGLFMTLNYDDSIEPNGVGSARVYFSDVSRTLTSKKVTDWLWTDVSFSLVEG